jgi:beta-galactosidase
MDRVIPDIGLQARKQTAGGLVIGQRALLGTNACIGSVLKLWGRSLSWAAVFILVGGLTSCARQTAVRERIRLNTGWRFYLGDPAQNAAGLMYDVRPEVEDRNDVVPADAMPTEAVKVEAKQTVLKPWIMPTGNRFIKDPARRYVRPEGNPGSDCPFVQGGFDDLSWESVNLPHDWAIKGPFLEGDDAHVGGGWDGCPARCRMVSQKD